mmetsp:Transcript_8848/g.21913  ORF Transcript_8848/g.21913 Transcript_8848/m.21913 type:complete len:317 (-) Transcript_8848:1129-2079(-)
MAVKVKPLPESAAARATGPARSHTTSPRSSTVPSGTSASSSSSVMPEKSPRSALPRSASSCAAAASSASASAARRAASARRLSTTCATRSGWGSAMSGRRLCSSTMAVSAACLTGATPLLASTVSAPSVGMAWSGGAAPSAPTTSSIWLSTMCLRATAARWRMAGSSATMASSTKASMPPLHRTSAADTSGTSASVASPPEAAIWHFSSSAPQKPTKILRSVDSGSVNRSTTPSAATRLERHSSAARCTSGLSHVSAICSVRQPPAPTMRSRSSGTVARLVRPRHASNCCSSLSASSTSCSIGLTIPSGPEPVRRG